MNEFNVSVTESPLAIRGEYEILVCDAPIFSHKIRFEKAKRIWDRKMGRVTWILQKRNWSRRAITHKILGLFSKPWTIALQI